MDHLAQLKLHLGSCIVLKLGGGWLAPAPPPCSGRPLFSTMIFDREVIRYKLKPVPIKGWYLSGTTFCIDLDTYIGVQNEES